MVSGLDAPVEQIARKSPPGLCAFPPVMWPDGVLQSLCAQPVGSGGASAFRSGAPLRMPWLYTARGIDNRVDARGRLMMRAKGSAESKAVDRSPGRWRAETGPEPTNLTAGVFNDDKRGERAAQDPLPAPHSTDAVGSFSAAGAKGWHPGNRRPGGLSSQPVSHGPGRAAQTTLEPHCRARRKTGLRPLAARGPGSLKTIFLWNKVTTG